VNGAAVDLPAMHFDAAERRAAPSSGKNRSEKLRNMVIFRSSLLLNDYLMLRQMSALRFSLARSRNNWYSPWIA
jgi:hypothetical protein